MKRVCKICKKDISEKRKQAKFCNEKCRNKDTRNRINHSIKFEDTYTQKYNFSLSLGFISVADAISNLGKNNFNERFKNEKRIL